MFWNRSCTFCELFLLYTRFLFGLSFSKIVTAPPLHPSVFLEFLNLARPPTFTSSPFHGLRLAFHLLSSSDLLTSILLPRHLLNISPAHPYPPALSPSLPPFTLSPSHFHTSSFPHLISIITAPPPQPHRRTYYYLSSHII